ncbi:hypothetical protein ABZX77_32435 [Streptomyces sp. NPDC004237]|uniref:hypothetical protein n=1 Tax=Streptomyces sp. NPDC004237 TaxID=3154455 RepID=UPI0033A210C7
MERADALRPRGLRDHHEPEDRIVAFDRTTGKPEGKLDGRSLGPAVLRSSLSGIVTRRELAADDKHPRRPKRPKDAVLSVLGIGRAGNG